MTAIIETGDDFGDGSHIIYVNGENTDDSALGRLMHDFHCVNPNEMLYPFLKERTRYLKHDTKGVSHMCKIMEEIKAEGYAEGWEDAKEQVAKAKEQVAEAKEQVAEAKEQVAEAKMAQAKAETEAAKEAKKAAEAEKRAALAERTTVKNVLRMLRDGLPIEKISEYSSLPLDEVQELAALTAH